VVAYRGRTWLELPWYFAEAFFYRRLLEAVRYFQPGPWQRHDPFSLQKRQQVQAAVSLSVEDWRSLDGMHTGRRFRAILHSCLWGNRADLSNYTVREQVRGGMTTGLEEHNLLIDHTEQVGALLSSQVDRVDFVNDNVGRELISDLVLADFLLEQGWVQQVVFHLKDSPFFVSDAMCQDVQGTVSLMAAERLGRRLEEHLAEGRLNLKDHAFWTSSLMYRQMPAALASDLACSDLVIVKGDVNYRRLLDDRRWPHTTPLEEIADYFPASYLVLRTLKGEIIVGLEPGQAEELSSVDPSWLINGKRGIIQFVRKEKE
jgi:uncharacterized protein with ATP-grasp and redox domains